MVFSVATFVGPFVQGTIVRATLFTHILYGTTLLWGFRMFIQGLIGAEFIFYRTPKGERHLSLVGRHQHITTPPKRCGASVSSEAVPTVPTVGILRGHIVLYSLKSQASGDFLF